MANGAYELMAFGRFFINKPLSVSEVAHTLASERERFVSLRDGAIFLMAKREHGAKWPLFWLPGGDKSGHWEEQLNIYITIRV